MLHWSRLARLHPKVQIEQARDRAGRPALLLVDESTRRSVALPADALPILRQLREGTDAAGILRTLEGEVGAEELESFTAQLAAQGYLEDGTPEDQRVRALTERAEAERWRSLRAVLRRAQQEVPFYRRRLAGIDVERLSRRPELAAVPLLQKAELRSTDPTELVPEGLEVQRAVERREVLISISSGTAAGERLQMLSSAEARGGQQVAGTMLHPALRRVAQAPQVVLTSAHCADPEQCFIRGSTAADRTREGRLTLLPPEDPGAPRKEEVDQLLAEIRDFGPAWFDCNPTYLAVLTYELVDRGVQPPPVKVVTAGYEYLSRIHRRLFAEVWGATVLSRFTASELGSFQMLECEAGALHVNDRYYFSELWSGDQPARPGEIGRLVQTTLRETIPLIRYDTEDLMIAAPEVRCGCGGLTPRVAAVAGRASDRIRRPDGAWRSTKEIDDALAEVPGLRFYQLRQAGPRAYKLRIVAEPSAEAGRVARDGEEALAAALGAGAEITSQAARRVYPEPSGKFRLVGS
jgi:phenylacetate-CoA ligase